MSNHVEMKWFDLPNLSWNPRTSEVKYNIKVNISHFPHSTEDEMKLHKLKSSAFP